MQDALGTPQALRESYDSAETLVALSLNIVQDFVLAVKKISPDC